MFRKMGIVLALGLVVGLAALGPATASAAVGTGTVAVANGQWQALPAGRQATHSFDYSGDGSQILIRMAAPSGGSFQVFTPEQYAAWQRGESVDPVGRGSASDIYGGDLIWSGDFNNAGKYYVIVNAGSGETDYALGISGSGVTLPAAQPSAAEAKPPAVAATASKPAEATPATAVEQKKGAGPGDALTAGGQWQPVSKNQEVWYAIPYGGGNAQVLVRMAVDPSSPASFAVYTANEAANGLDPVGRGSADASLGGDLVWSGNFADAGMLHVVVSGNGVGDTGYALTIQ